MAFFVCSWADVGKMGGLNGITVPLSHMPSVLASSCLPPRVLNAIFLFTLSHGYEIRGPYDQKHRHVAT